MKQLLTLLLTSSVFAAFAADIQVNNSGQPGTYNTIQLAINNAVDGDRIVINPFTVYIENVTVNKTLTFISSVSGTNYVVNGTIQFVGADNREIILIGAEISNATAQTGTSTGYTNKVTIVDSKIDILTSQEFSFLSLLYCSINGTVNMINGDIIGSFPTSNNFNISINDASTSIGDTIRLIANSLNKLTINSDDFFIFAANNSLEESVMGGCSGTENGNLLIVNKLKYDANKENIFLNNYFWARANGTVSSYSMILFNLNINYSNTLFINNNFSNIACGSGTKMTLYSAASLVNRPKMYYNLSNTGWTPQTFQQITSNIVGGSGTNLGHPGIQYYDVDLTRNDIGHFGGPYTQFNYHLLIEPGFFGPGARIYNLEMPFEIWNGSTPTIKADGTEMK